MISKLLVLGAYATALVSVLIGLFCFSPIPTKLGFWRFIASQTPQLVGVSPAAAFLPWKYTWEEFYQNDLTGQTAIVTGANAGIGYDLAFSLAKVGASVTLVCRNQKRCEDARSQMIQDAPANTDLKENLSTMIMDTASLASVRAFAETYIQENASKKNIDMLFFNAGSGVVLADPEHPKCAVKTKEDQIDSLFQVNYLGHHLLYRLLEPYLSPKARIIHTSSAGSFDTYSYKVATNLQTLHGCSEPFDEGMHNPVYGQSKLAQILWVKALTRRLGPDSKILANAFHPGMASTSIQDKAIEEMKLGGLLRAFLDFSKTWAWQSPDGALTGLYLGVTEEIHGKYFHPQAEEVVNPFSLDEKLQDDLWAFSDQLVEAFLAPIHLSVPEVEEEIAEDNTRPEEEAEEGEPSTAD